MNRADPEGVALARDINPYDPSRVRGNGLIHTRGRCPRLFVFIPFGDVSAVTHVKYSEFHGASFLFFDSPQLWCLHP